MAAFSNGNNTINNEKILKKLTRKRQDFADAKVSANSTDVN